MPSALELFGGRDAVLKKMTEAVRKQFEDWSIRAIKEIEQLLGINDSSLQSLLVPSQQRISYDLFRRLAKRTQLNLQDAIGKASFADPALKKIWEEESQRAVIAFGASVPPPDGKVPLDLFVLLCVAEELERATAPSAPPDYSQQVNELVAMLLA